MIVREIKKVKEFLMTAADKRVFGLDILRACAILLVLVSHSRFYLKESLFGTEKYLSLGGFFGVELFFVLSGFLIGGLLIKQIEEGGSRFNFHSVRIFWIRRWFRTLPNYYFILMINVVILSVATGAVVFDPLYLLFLQNLLWPLRGQMNYDQSWSLSVEEWFYLLLPVIILIVFFFVRSTKKALLIIIVSSICILPLFKYLYLVLAEHFGKGALINISTFRAIALLRLDSIMFGVLIAYISFFFKPWLTKQQKNLLFIGCVLIAILIFYNWSLIQQDSVSVSPFALIAIQTVVSLSFTLIIPFFNGLRNVSTRFRFLTQFITLTSVVSYSLYLIHYSIVIPFVATLQIPMLLQFVIFWILSYLLSILNYHYFENPMTKLRERFNHRITHAAR
jgi:peptidoglycan/LPS O-acetylase OafA/YrhL